MKQAFETNTKRTSLFFSIVLAFSFSASTGSAQDANCGQKMNNARNSFLRACQQARLVDNNYPNSISRCQEHAEFCSEETPMNSCQGQEKKLRECVLSYAEIDRILANKKAEKDEAEQALSERQDSIQEDKKESAGQQSDMMDQLLGQMDKKAEADKTFYEAQQDYLQTLNEKNDEFLQTKRDTEGQMIETSDSFTQQQADMRDNNIQRLNETNQQMAGLKKEQNSLFSQRLAAGKAVRDEVRLARDQCRAALRQYEAQIGNQITAAANSTDARTRSQLNAGSLSGIGGFQSKIRKIQDDMYAQCIEDSQEAIQLARQQQTEMNQIIQLKEQEIQQQEVIFRQNQENQNAADQQRLVEARQTVVQKQNIAQQQIGDAQNSRDAAVNNAGVVLQNAERIRDEAKANADRGVELAWTQSLMGQNLMGGGGGGNPSQNLGNLKETANDAKSCYNRLRNASGQTKGNRRAMKLVYEKYDTFQGVKNSCESSYAANGGGNANSDSVAPSTNRGPSAATATAVP